MPVCVDAWWMLDLALDAQPAAARRCVLDHDTVMIIPFAFMIPLSYVLHRLHFSLQSSPLQWHRKVMYGRDLINGAYGRQQWRSRDTEYKSR